MGEIVVPAGKQCAAVCSCAFPRDGSACSKGIPGLVPPECDGFLPFDFGRGVCRVGCSWESQPVPVVGRRAIEAGRQ